MAAGMVKAASFSDSSDIPDRENNHVRYKKSEILETKQKGTKAKLEETQRLERVNIK